MANRLITFRPSHYCEKARWALDRARIAYAEESHIPVLSWIASFGAGAGRTVPALVTDGEVVSDSTDILHWVDRQGAVEPLFPEDLPDVAILEDDFDVHLGPAARRIVYFHLLPHADRLREVMYASGPPWEVKATRVLFPLIRALIVRGLNVTAAAAERSRRVMDDSFARVGARLADGRRYLSGDRFTAADLTFAALSYLAVWPEEIGAVAPPYEEVPAALRAEIEARRETPAGRFALRLWAEERR